MLPVLGCGIGFRPQFISDLFLNRDKVDFLEIVVEHYLNVPLAKKKELELLAEHFTIIPHGLNLSIGSAEGLDTGYIKKLAGLINELNPPWWSEHISFSRAGGTDIGHLSPLPFTNEAVDVVCRNIETVREFIKQPLILENITYLFTVPASEMTEAEFIIKILEKSGCGMLLDVTNLYTNSVNHGYDPYDFLRQLPPEKIVQLHFAGGYWSDGILLDSHSQPAAPEVFELIKEVVKLAPLKGIILERDDNFPKFSELLEELEQAGNIFKKGNNDFRKNSESTGLNLYR
jgi:uncharacterized protein (UPF0276 family)